MPEFTVYLHNITSEIIIYNVIYTISLRHDKSRYDLQHKMVHILLLH